MAITEMRKEPTEAIDLSRMVAAKKEIKNAVESQEKQAILVVAKIWDMHGRAYPKDSPLRNLLG